MGSSVSKPPGASLQLAPPSQPKSSFVPILGGILMIGLVFAAVIVASRYSGPAGVAATTTDHAPTEVDGKTGSTVASAISGSNTSLQFWMYIKDWDYKFGQKKYVIGQISATNLNVTAPQVSLHPTDNALDFSVSVYPSGSDMNTTNVGGSTAQIVTVENVPLQSWFAVSTTIYGRKFDVYINGRLVKSAVLDGVPMPASGNLVIGGAGGFAGSVCTVHTSSTKIEPADAAAFYAAGSACAGSSSSSSSQLSNLSLFGYTFVFGVKDSSGKDVNGLSSSDVSGWFSSPK